MREPPGTSKAPPNRWLAVCFSVVQLRPIPGALGVTVELVPSDYDDGCQAGNWEGEPVNRVLVARRR